MSRVIVRLTDRNPLTQGRWRTRAFPPLNLAFLLATQNKVFVFGEKRKKPGGGVGGGEGVEGKLKKMEKCKEV